MNKSSRMAILLLTIMAAFIGGAISRTLSTTQPVHAQQSAEATSKTQTQMWEHCAVAFANDGISMSGSRATASVRIYYLRGTGYEQERIEATIDENVRGQLSVYETAVAKAVAKLSDEGWQMISEGDFLLRGNRGALYFRRPKP